MLSPGDRILVERAALQLVGTQPPISHVCAVLRGLGMSPVQAAPLFPDIEARIRELEVGIFHPYTTAALACDIGRPADAA